MTVLLWVLTIVFFTSSSILAALYIKSKFDNDILRREYEIKHEQYMKLQSEYLTEVKWHAQNRDLYQEFIETEVLDAVNFARMKAIGDAEKFRRYNLLFHKLSRGCK